MACSDNKASLPKLNVAVASNFQIPMSALVEAFQQRHPETDISISSASSGVLLAQIKRGAPFELFFSADSERPLKLADNMGLTDNVHTYAIGQLVFWAPDMNEVNSDSIAQIQGKIAIAKPELAPYGLATKQALQEQGLWSGLQSNIVYGNNVTQVEHFIKTGAVDAGFLSLAQVIHSKVEKNNVWIIPSEDYALIEQKVILLERNGEAGLSQRFLDFVLSDQGQTIISELGYGLLKQDGLD